jgi:hypothetical protein
MALAHVCAIEIAQSGFDLSHVFVRQPGNRMGVPRAEKETAEESGIPISPPRASQQHERKLFLLRAEILGISKVGKVKEKSGMPDGTGTTRDEIHRAMGALTAAELLRLKRFSVWRMRALGRAACGRTWEDLLGEAKLAILEGAANNGSGRRWKESVDPVSQLAGAIRSISSHWKRDFDEQEPELESEISTADQEGNTPSPLDGAVSNAPSQERDLVARQQWNLIVARCRDDRIAIQVLDGLSLGLTPSEIMNMFTLTRWEYHQATARIRRRALDLN